MGFSLLTSNIVIVLSEQQRGLRESILRQVDKKSRVYKGNLRVKIEKANQELAEIKYNFKTN